MINPYDADPRFMLAIQQQQVTARYGVTKFLGQHCHLIGRDRRLNLHLKQWVPAQVPQKLVHRFRRHNAVPLVIHIFARQIDFDLQIRSGQTPP